jgi:hypothetical protein
MTKPLIDVRIENLGEFKLAEMPKDLLRTVRGFLRVLPSAAAVLCQRGGSPRVAFLPSKGREMASLLRIYRLAEEMQRIGWIVLVLPPTLTLAQRHRLLRQFGADVLVMQGARHPLNRPGLYPGDRIVYDMDDADFHLPHLAEPVRQAMDEVALVLAGSRYVADWCRSRGARARVVWTGTPPSVPAPPPQSGRPPIVAWAQSAPVDYGAERAFVLDVMRRVAARREGVRLRLFGRRSEDTAAILEPFEDAGVHVEWMPMMTYTRFLHALDDVAVGLSPICPETPFSRGKSFGKVLAYLDRAVPVVASAEADHALFFPPGSGVLSDDPATCADAVLGLLDDAPARQTMADAAGQAFRARLSTEAAAREVDVALRRLLTQKAAPAVA